MDTSEPNSPLPQLPGNLDDPVALEAWRCAWNTWIADESSKRNWLWLKPITTAMLNEIVEGEKQLRVDLARGNQQVELATARSDLNALEMHLRATDPQYEAKRALLVPILQPLFKHISPANWRALFEQVYARLQVPTDGRADEQQRELAEARHALNSLEERLRNQDPAYEAKRAILVPILKPIFRNMPPSKWVAAFEEAYAGVQLPTESPAQRATPTAEPSEGCEPVHAAITDAQATRDKFFAEFETASSSEQRSALLAMFKAAMDIRESSLAKSGDAQRLAKFREARADDYAQLLVKESCVGEDVSPEMFMAVTNREIAEGRLTPDDPIRQLALKAAAAAHPSHAELLERAEARKASDVSIEALKNEILTAKTFDIVEMRKKLLKEFDAAVTSDQRGKVLAIYKAIADLIERQLSKQGDANLLEDFRKAQDQEYKIFIVQECTVGLDSPDGGNVSVDMLMAVTNREIAANRMTEEHSLRKIAVDGAAAPHLSHAELVEKHTKLTAHAVNSSGPAPQSANWESRKSYAFGTALARSLKGLFRK